MNITCSFTLEEKEVVKLNRQNLFITHTKFFIIMLLVGFWVTKNSLMYGRYLTFIIGLTVYMIVIYLIVWSGMPKGTKRRFDQFPFYREIQTVEITDQTFKQFSETFLITLPWDGFKTVVIRPNYISFFIKTSGAYIVPTSAISTAQIQALKEALTAKKIKVKIRK